MTVLTLEYMRETPVHFEPASLDEAEQIQRKLFTMGYAWPNGARVAFARQCASMGLTALPDGRLLCGLPDDVTARYHTYQDFFAPAPVPVMVTAPAPVKSSPAYVPPPRRKEPEPEPVSAEIARLAALVEKVLGETRVAREQSRFEISQGFSDLARRIGALEAGQKTLVDKVEQLAKKVAPAPLELRKNGK